MLDGLDIDGIAAGRKRTRQRLTMIGVAAAVCVADGTTTHNVDIKKVQKILCTEQDVPLPRQENTDPELVRELEEYKYGTYTEAAKKIRAAAGLDW